MRLRMRVANALEKIRTKRWLSFRSLGALAGTTGPSAHAMLRGSNIGMVTLKVRR